MKLNYFPDTDSLYIDLSQRPSVESQEVSEGVVLDYDAEGNLVGIDIDHASSKLDLRELVTNHIPLEERRRSLSPVCPLYTSIRRWNELLLVPRLYLSGSEIIRANQAPARSGGRSGPCDRSPASDNWDRRARLSSGPPGVVPLKRCRWAQR